MPVRLNRDTGQYVLQARAPSMWGLSAGPCRGTSGPVLRPVRRIGRPAARPGPGASLPGTEVAADLRSAALRNLYSFPRFLLAPADDNTSRCRGISARSGVLRARRVPRWPPAPGPEALQPIRHLRSTLITAHPPGPPSRLSPRARPRQRSWPWRPPPGQQLTSRLSSGNFTGSGLLARPCRGTGTSTRTAWWPSGTPGAAAAPRPA